MNEMGDLTKLLSSALETCLANGMELPFVCVAAAVNGSVFAVRYEQDGDGLRAAPLAEHIQGGAFVVPINIMIMDQTGEAVRVSIDRAGAATYH
jgi:hypothetical protein